MAYAGAAAAAAIARAIKASGAIVRLEPADFLTILGKTRAPLVVISEGGLLKKNHQYLSAYKGLIFFAKSADPLPLPGDAEVVAAKQIWIPS